ncbi:arginine--tRNA ligase [Sorangium sp. So ce1335]|uniref:arginine--tRNA ligase n=1 Tax=Sorangium sp. So ce1335 TaxID=3133335 RepID=UPI003F63E78F
MADPVHALARALQAAITAAFGVEHAATDPSLRRSSHADYQANAAMALGKRLGRPPREVAAAIVAKLEVGGICRKVEIAGPGFVNLTLDDAYLTGELAETAGSGRLGVAPAAQPETVVVDYSGPNAAKEMHVGHLRSTIIGDALARVLEALGHRVIRQNHLGDWGTPFGMLIEHMLDLGEAAAAEELSVGDLDAFYRQARAKFDGDPAFVERSRQRVVRLQGGDEPTLALWRKLVRESTRYFDSVYRRLGVTLTEADFAGESFYNPMLADVIAELTGKGLARESEGALCVFPAGFTGKGGEPLPLIVRKQDGGYGYATTDLAAIRHRLTTVGAQRLVYVVGAPQSQHFAMVFATAREAGWLRPPARAEHVAFGSVLGADKKMFKTRSGDTVKLSSLLDEAVERATKVVREKNPELDAEAAGAVARAVGVGAVKYADLSSDRIKDYVFDWDRMLAFEGNTAPYLMYAHARIRSIFRKGGVTSARGAEFLLGEPSERALALELLRFGAVLEDVAATLQPHHLCGYLYELARSFTTFFECCPVLKADSEALRRSRLALCDITAGVLAKGLGLLGIEAPERM